MLIVVDYLRKEVTDERQLSSFNLITGPTKSMINGHKTENDLVCCKG